MLKRRKRDQSVTLVTDDWAIVVPTAAATMDGFRKWVTAPAFPQRMRVTFLKGAIFLDGSNEEINTHLGVRGDVGCVLSNLVKGQRLGKFYSAGLLLSNAEAGFVTNPDAIFLSKQSLASGRVRLVPMKGADRIYREIEGTPDWVLEVVSEGTEARDRGGLRDAYHRAGVAEYWLIDAETETLRFEILTRRKDKYVRSAGREGWHRSKVFNRSFRLDRVLDDYGLWEYTLHVRED